MILTWRARKRSLRRYAPCQPSCSLIALFVALSGTSVALPGKNRVDRNDAKGGSIGTRAVANNSIRTEDMRNGHVRTSDISDG